MKIGDSSIAPSVRSGPWMLSGHEALWWFMFFCNLRSPSSVTSSRRISGCGLGPRLGRPVVLCSLW